MCINSACENIRKPSICRGPRTRTAGDALPGIENRTAGLAFARQGATASPSPARPAVQLSAVSLSVSAPSDLRPTKSAPPPKTSPGTVPATGDAGPCRLPLACPLVPGKPLSPNVPDAAAATPGALAPLRRPWILTSCGGFLGGQPLEADVALQHGVARCPAPVRPGRTGSRKGGDEVTPRGLQ